MNASRPLAGRNTSASIKASQCRNTVVSGIKESCGDGRLGRPAKAKTSATVEERPSAPRLAIGFEKVLAPAALTHLRFCGIKKPYANAGSRNAPLALAHPTGVPVAARCLESLESVR